MLFNNPSELEHVINPVIIWRLLHTFFLVFSLGLSAYKAGHWLVYQCAWYV